MQTSAGVCVCLCGGERRDKNRTKSGVLRLVINDEYETGGVVGGGWCGVELQQVNARTIEQLKTNYVLSLFSTVFAVVCPLALLIALKISKYWLRLSDEISQFVMSTKTRSG